MVELVGLYGRGVGDGGLEVGVPASEASMSEVNTNCEQGGARREQRQSGVSEAKRCSGGGALLSERSGEFGSNKAQVNTC